MAIRNIYSAESWERVYEAFNNISFVSYDFDTVKAALLDYVKLYYSESFNDFIESSEFIAFLEMFAYVAEVLAYRVDLLSHENFITTAQRKQSILRLAKLISYKVTRNIPGRGLVKVTSIVTSERIIDSQGINLANTVIKWNDPNNSNWKEQFFLVLNHVLVGKFGQPQKSIQVDDVNLQLYNFANISSAFVNGVFPFIADTGTEQFPMEVVPVDIDANGPFERTPDPTQSLSFIYSSDGLGDGSDYTGILLFVKQGGLVRTDYTISAQIPNRTLELNLQNVNETDVWLTRVDTNGNVLERWEQVNTLAEQNLFFNGSTTRKKFEVETLENDRIKLIFGDGDFTDMPIGTFQIWTRQSINKAIVIQANRVQNQPINFSYTSNLGLNETCALTFSLTSAIQNSAASETIDHIRQAAPATYYAQNRMVNAADHNTFMLKDQSILRLFTINRTFAGQPKWIDWNDASGTYENIKLFGDDLQLRYNLITEVQNTSVSARSLIDNVIEPLLSSTSIMNVLLHISATDPDLIGVISAPRRLFIEDNRIPLLEKTMIQGALDRHWYGEPLGLTTINGVTYALIPSGAGTSSSSDDGKIWQETLPRTIDGITPYVNGDSGSRLQTVAIQQRFGLRFNRKTNMRGSGTLVGTITSAITEQEVFTIEVAADEKTLYVTSSVRGNLSNGVVDKQYSLIDSSAPIDFIVTNIDLKQGDAFIIRPAVGYAGAILPDYISTFNLNGYWEIINGTSLPANPDSLSFDPVDPVASWVFWIERILAPVTNDLIGFTIHYRSLKLVATSQNTKFWFNQSDQILDNETKDRVYDTIRVLRSNLKPNGLPLGHNENYDVVGPIVDGDGVIDIHSLEIMPSDAMALSVSGDTIPDKLLQFENFSANTYVYTTSPITPSSVYYDSIPIGWPAVTFNPGSFVDTTGNYLRFPTRKSLDFMWQHFAPYSNMIDPSASNIHDAFILTSGYYNNVISYVRGLSNVPPVPPTPLELRQSYGYLLENKMLSDTIVLHAGKIRLLFGELAEPQLRARFKVVVAPTAKLSTEVIKQEVLNVINTYFDISNWDFGNSFYATELIALIHQRLPTEISSVVLVPSFSTNSFGSLFTVQCGMDEILQSAARITDIEIVADLTRDVLRQGRLA
ncbi:MAG: hypothetical protein QXN55_01810 [Candidatus Nitrosotenuis sp.]